MCDLAHWMWVMCWDAALPLLLSSRTLLQCSSCFNWDIISLQFFLLLINLCILWYIRPLTTGSPREGTSVQPPAQSMINSMNSDQIAQGFTKSVLNTSKDGDHEVSWTAYPNAWLSLWWKLFPCLAYTPSYFNLYLLPLVLPSGATE